MHSYCINKLLNIEGVIVKKVVHGDISVKIFLETKPSTQKCPCCGAHTKRIHDYRVQTIKDLPLQMKHCYLVLKKRRYVCSCGKRFFEKYSFLPRYYQRTRRLSCFVASELHQTQSLKDIAKRTNLSSSTVGRILDSVNCLRKPFTDAISIDEFKGNAEGEKYQCILVDPLKHKVIDVIPGRTQNYLTEYFRGIPKSERHRVKFFACDMWRPFTDIARAYFPNAKIVIDRYHFVRQATWAIENVRKRVQKTMLVSHRRYFKRSRSLILRRYNTLSKDEKEACELMLYYNDDLRQAHYLKEKFYDLCQETKYSIQREAFRDWIRMAEQSSLKEFQHCARTYRNWSKEILNAFKYGYISNGPTEGFNNKIKVLKRVSFGLKNFKRFRNRILLVTN